jgi:DNA mismatch repair protein MSH5
LRIAVPTDFKYEAGRNKLLSLDINLDNKPTMLFTSNIEDIPDAAGEENGHSGDQQSKYMQLASKINLNSRISVSI